MNNDITQELKDTENSLRDFITTTLMTHFGENWLLSSWVTQERIEKWQEKKIIEEKKFNNSVAIEERLMYYADFYDLKTIFEKNWNEFEVIFGDKKRFLVYLDIIWDFRNPDAHRRELFPHQKNLIIGIAWEIRNAIVKYRSKNEIDEDYFPKIECIRENLWRIWLPQSRLERDKITVRVDNIVELVVTATDPKDWEIKYWIYKSHNTDWNKDNVIKYKFTEKDIWKGFSILIVIKSDREYHAYDESDDRAVFSYIVLPRK